MEPSRLLEPIVRGVEWRDLRGLSGLQVCRELLLAPPWLVLSLVLAERGYLAPALAASAVLFMAGLRQAHGAFHLTLGLPRRMTDGFLFLLSLVLCVPLHAIRHNHLRHHADPLAPDDVEGMAARMPGWLAVISGPLFTARMLWNAARRARSGARAWMALETAALASLGALAFSVEADWLRYHILAMLLGNCLTGFFAVWIVHRGCDRSGIFARTQRGRLVNLLTLNLFYHLEHHLFPAVPTCRLPELARRLDAALPAARELPVLGAPPDQMSENSHPVASISIDFGIALFGRKPRRVKSR